MSSSSTSVRKRSSCPNSIMAPPDSPSFVTRGGRKLGKKKPCSASKIKVRKTPTKRATGALKLSTIPVDEDQTASRKRVSKHAATLPVHDPLFEEMDETTERRLSTEVYGKELCHFDCEYFSTLHEEEAMTILKTENPDVCEGGLECRRCKSNKIYSRSIQIRGGDEGTSVFAVCSECNFSWREC